MRGKISHTIFSFAEKTAVKLPFISAGLIIVAMCSTSCTKPQVIKSETESAVIEEAETLYKSPVWTDRIRAINMARDIKSLRAEQLLIDASDDEYPRVRIETLDSLAKFRSQKAFETVKNSAENETDKSVKWTAVKSLSQYQNPLAAEVFIHALSQDDWLIREEAIRGLLAIHDPETEKISVEIILRALSDPSESVRIAALMNLRVDDSRIYSVLKVQISDEKNRSRFTYLKALLTALAYYKLDNDVRRIVLTLITHPNTEIRVLALRCVKSSDVKVEEPEN